jgi:cytochrome c5
MKPVSLAIFVLALMSSAAAGTALAAAQSQSPSNTPSQSSAKKTSNHSQAPDPGDEGQAIFHQNCSRCHKAPEGFSPRISGTIVRHMRVRASLSEHDERAILHFLNP